MNVGWKACYKIALKLLACFSSINTILMTGLVASICQFEIRELMESYSVIHLFSRADCGIADVIN